MKVSIPMPYEEKKNKQKNPKEQQQHICYSKKKMMSSQKNENAYLIDLLHQTSAETLMIDVSKLTTYGKM
jgi:hypothetical protein